MNLILLSGESINNKTWIIQVEQQLKEFFNSSKILYYDHWQTGEQFIDLDKEFLKLVDFVKDQGDYFLFAKSIGSVLSLRGIHEGILKPKKCFFVGPAFLVGEKNTSDFKNWIQDFNTPSIVLTKSLDPVAPAKEVNDLLKRYDVQNNKFIEIPGDNHKYEDLDQIKKLMVDFIK